jgi:hypothetical protein
MAPVPALGPRLGPGRAAALAGLILTLILGACSPPPPNTLGPEGGMVEHEDGVRIEVPPGALLDKVTFEIEKSARSIPGALGPAYTLSPQGLTFLIPVRVTLPYKRTDILPTDVDEPVFVLRAAASGAISNLGGTVVSAGRVQIQTTDLATFAPASHAPALIAGQQGAPLGLAVSASHVYWTQRPGQGQAGNVMRAALSAAAASTAGQPEVFVAGTELADPRHLLIAGGSLYVGYGGTGTGDGGIARVPLGGGAATKLAPATAPGPMVVDERAVYFVDGEAILRAELSGGAPVTLSQTGAKPMALLADEDSLYWVNRGTIAGFDGRVMRVAKKGGAATELATGQAEPVSLALDLDQDHVYWVTKGDGKVRWAPRAGGAATTLRSLMRPTAVAVYGDSYYVADVLSAKLLVYPKAGGKGLARSTTEGSVGRIVLDERTIYWITEGTLAAQGSVRLISR